MCVCRRAKCAVREERRRKRKTEGGKEQACVCMRGRQVTGGGKDEYEKNAYERQKENRETENSSKRKHRHRAKGEAKNG